MRSIPKPTDAVSDVFKTCISQVQDNRLKKRLTATLPEIVIAANQFTIKAPKSKLHTIRRMKRFKSGATSREINKIYTTRMVPKASPGRLFYQKILSSAPLDICPLCGQRPVSTLDHYLDKSDYPQYSVTPINLVPSCKDCNFAKATFPIPINANDFTIHPYFDNIDQHTWLTCTLPSAGTKVRTRFAVAAHPSWNSVLADRVKRHFQVFDLEKLYSIQAAVELNTKKQKLLDIFKNGGPNDVRDQLEGDARSHQSAYRNAWSTALYSALATSDWFHREGVKWL